MLKLFIAYTILFALIYAAELGIKFNATRKKVAVVKTNALRIIEPLKVLAAIFAITIIELLVFDVFNVITEGFIKANNIFFGIVAGIFAVDYLFEQYKLRCYDRVILNAPMETIKDKDEIKLLQRVRGGYYARRFSTDYINKNYNGVIKPNARKLIIKTIAIASILIIILIVGVLLILFGPELLASNN